MGVVRPSGIQNLPGTPLGVAVLGATGSVGQRFVQLLAQHAWFRVDALCASKFRQGKVYGDEVRWVQASELSTRLAAFKLQDPAELQLERTPLVFSALPSSVAGPVEQELAARGFWVISNAASHRMHKHVPLLIPEVNEAHLGWINIQKGPGAILAGPNCSTAGLSMALAPLQRRFGLKAIIVTTMQAHSGAGLPGVLGSIADNNVLPYIGGEEYKLETEPLKILGKLVGDQVESLELPISATCNRVPVVDGHTECVTVRLEKPAQRQQLIEAWTQFPGVDSPSAPEHPLVYLDDEMAPNPKTHAALHGGMSTIIGQLRTCPVMDWKFTLLSHNTLRGAAGGAILIGERLVRYWQSQG